jgi:hypothetical protein
VWGNTHLGGTFPYSPAPSPVPGTAYDGAGGHGSCEGIGRRVDRCRGLTGTMYCLSAVQLKYPDDILWW